MFISCDVIKFNDHQATWLYFFNSHYNRFHYLCSEYPPWWNIRCLVVGLAWPDQVVSIDITNNNKLNNNFLLPAEIFQVYMVYKFIYKYLAFVLPCLASRTLRGYMTSAPFYVYIMVILLPGSMLPTPDIVTNIHSNQLNSSLVPCQYLSCSVDHKLWNYSTCT